MKSIVSKAKTIINSFLKKDFIPEIDHYCQKERFGSQYGGWDIAVGQIDKNSIIYSFGVGEDASFDIALIERYGVTIHAFDPTPKSIKWAKSQMFSKKFILHEYGIADFDGDVLFNPPEDPNHVSHTILSRPATQERAITVQVKKLVTIMKDLGHDKIDIIKMDVEGAEYQVIEDICKSDIRPRQILVEFHHRFDNVGIKETKHAIMILKRIKYRVFSVSTSVELIGFIYENSDRLGDL